MHIYIYIIYLYLLSEYLFWNVWGRAARIIPLKGQPLLHPLAAELRTCLLYENLDGPVGALGLQSHAVIWKHVGGPEWILQISQPGFWSHTGRDIWHGFIVRLASDGRPIVMDFEGHMTNQKRKQLRKTSQGMVKKTICKQSNRIWVTLWLHLVHLW